MSSRLKIVAPVIKTRAGLEAAVREILDHQLARESLIARRDTEIAAVNERYNPGIDERARAIETRLRDVELWAQSNRDAEFGPAKSIDVAGARMGWRVGNPTATLRKKWKWASVVEAIKGLPAALRDQFLRVKEEPNKEAMIAARESHAEVLAGIGVEISQAETFYLDPAREGQESATLRGEQKEAA